jgi:hypothetical protein
MSDAVSLPRGIRNNNPGNLRPGPAWAGIAGQDQEEPDPPYLQFIDPAHGIRAIARTLIAYHDLHGIKTVAGVFARWAPAGDNNDPDSYAAAVASALGVGVSDPIDLHDAGVLVALAQAITRQENGASETPWYEDAVFHQGVTLALGAEG